MTPALRLLPALHDYVESLPDEFDPIPEERKQTLGQIAEFVRRERAAGRSAKLVFICTHNSRRSHMSQVWAATAAAYHGLEGIETYSGGTEATAFNPRAVAALARAGFDIPAPAPADNPHYQLAYASGRASLEAFSKVYSAPSNPQAEFAAIMNCSEADEACPFVRGATFRIALAYDDPKLADGTPDERARYDERCRQIAREMFDLFAQLRA
jgi:protein-tyrosine-phosphatase